MEYKKVFINERYADNGEFSHYELIDENGEVLCSEEDKERINLITVERNSAIQSQKDQFEEMDKQIQELKKENLRLIAKEARSRGELTGTLKGILFWEIPRDLAEKITNQLEGLRKDQKPIDSDFIRILNETCDRVAKINPTKERF